MQVFVRYGLGTLLKPNSGVLPYLPLVFFLRLIFIHLVRHEIRKGGDHLKKCGFNFYSRQSAKKNRKSAMWDKR